MHLAHWTHNLSSAFKHQFSASVTDRRLIPLDTSLGSRLAPFLLSWLILRVGKKSQCYSSLWSRQLLFSICESLLGGSSKSHKSELITVQKWNFYKCFSKVTFWGAILFCIQILDYLEFFGFTLYFRIFQAKFVFQIFFSQNHVVCLQFRLVSSILELQSKSWILELKLELSALWELSQSCSYDPAFRKGLHSVRDEEKSNERWLGLCKLK